MRELSTTDIAEAIADSFENWSGTERLANLDIEVLIELEAALDRNATFAEVEEYENDYAAAFGFAADAAYVDLFEVMDLVKAIESN